MVGGARAVSEDSIQAAPSAVEKVGVILVHGIGEQRRFEHLESETRKIVDAIINRYGERRCDVTITLTSGAGDEFQADQSSWVSGPHPPIHALVDYGGKIVDIAFHEVWWADVNEVLTLWKQIRFWLWGLSLPGFVTRHEWYLPGAANMRSPRRAGTLTIKQRLRIYYVSTLFGVSAISISLINLILKRLSFSPLFSTATLVNYLSGVKLYSQDQRAGGSPMDGPDEPPRFAIRRRMIRAMTDVATAGYARWYIVAHSLGTVVAWNGLMETAEALPNYLDQDRWNALRPPLRGTCAPFDVTAMLPNRPVWLDDQDIIDRDVLFEKFKGVLTYGAPLERFAALWSSLVPLNRHQDPFPAGAEWINVYDPTDPVGTWLKDFNPSPAVVPRPGRTTLAPQNFPCRASPVLLLSHICYLTASRFASVRSVNDEPNLLVNCVADWLVRGGELTNRLASAPKHRRTFWMPHAHGKFGSLWWRAAWRYVQWVIVGLLLTLATLLSLHWVIYPLLGIKILMSQLFEHLSRNIWLSSAAEAVCVWVAAAIVVFLASFVHHAIGSSEHEDLQKRVRIQTAKAQPQYRRLRSG
jgi:hypothetical protein